MIGDRHHCFNFRIHAPSRGVVTCLCAVDMRWLQCGLTIAGLQHASVCVMCYNREQVYLYKRLEQHPLSAESSVDKGTNTKRLHVCNVNDRHCYTEHEAMALVTNIYQRLQAGRVQHRIH